MKCTICQQPYQPAFTKLGYSITRCSACGLYRTHLKIPYPQMIKKYYTKAYFIGSRNRAGYANYYEDRKIISINSQNYLKMFSTLSPGRLLDVGCAMGIFLEEAKKIGWDAWGIDVSAYAIAKARVLHGQKVKQGTLSPRSFPNQKFDVVTLLDVFEHVGNPRALLKAIHALLPHQGLLIINTGDSSSLLARIEGKNWHYFIPPQHVYFYSRHNFKQLLESEGFKVKRIYHYGKRLSLRYLFHLMRTINHSSVANLIYKLIHKNAVGKLPVYINLRDNMTIIAQKI